MRILVATPFLPHAAASHGGGVYLTALLDALAEQADVALVSFATPAELEARSSPVGRLARADLVALPQRADFGGARRIAYRARMLGRWICGSPLIAAKFRSVAMASVLTKAAREFDPDACLVEFSVMAQYLPLLAGRRRVLTDHEAGTSTPVEILPGGIGRARDERLWRSYVEARYRDAEQVQALNHEDAATLGSWLGRSVAVRPATASIPSDSVDPSKAPARALFLGDYSHHPNPVAASFLAREVWPLVRRMNPTAELWIAGSRATPEVESLARFDGVSVRGFVPDLAGLLAEVRCLLAPVFSGAGSRIKVLTALAHGLPVVANRLGLRGIGAPEEVAASAESADELADHVARWLGDPGGVGAAGAAARAWAEGSVSPSAVATRQLELLLPSDPD